MSATTSLPAAWIEELLVWADEHHPEAAQKTRAVAHRPGVHERYLGRLDELWWRWAARTWAGWTPAQRHGHRSRAEELEQEGASAREADREAFLGLHAGEATT